MRRFLQHITWMIVLPFFLMASMSPLYLSTMDDGGGMASLHPAGNKATIGIVWLSVLIDSIVPDHESGSRAGFTAVRSGQDDDMVLIKRKRVLARKYFTCDPIFEVSTLEPAEDKTPILHASTFAIPHDLIHGHSDGYYTLRAGLSPPSFLS